MSCTRTLVETRAPASRHTRAAALSNGTPAVPEPLHARKLRGGGHRDRVDGRTGNKQHTRVKDTGATFGEGTKNFFLGYKKLFLGCKKLFWDTRNFFGIQETFGGIQGTFFGIQGTFFGIQNAFSGNKIFRWTTERTAAKRPNEGFSVGLTESCECGFVTGGVLSGQCCCDLFVVLWTAPVG